MEADGQWYLFAVHVCLTCCWMRNAVSLPPLVPKASFHEQVRVSVGVVVGGGVLNPSNAPSEYLCTIREMIGMYGTVR